VSWNNNDGNGLVVLAPGESTFSSVVIDPKSLAPNNVADWHVTLGGPVASADRVVFSMMYPAEVMHQITGTHNRKPNPQVQYQGSDYVALDRYILDLGGSAMGTRTVLATIALDNPSSPVLYNTMCGPPYYLPPLNLANLTGQITVSPNADMVVVPASSAPSKVLVGVMLLLAGCIVVRRRIVHQHG